MSTHFKCDVCHAEIMTNYNLWRPANNAWTIPQTTSAIEIRRFRFNEANGDGQKHLCSLPCLEKVVADFLNNCRESIAREEKMRADYVAPEKAAI